MTSIFGDDWNGEVYEANERRKKERAREVLTSCFVVSAVVRSTGKRHEWIRCVLEDGTEISAERHSGQHIQVIQVGNILMPAGSGRCESVCPTGELLALASSVVQEGIRCAQSPCIVAKDRAVLPTERSFAR